MGFGDGGGRAMKAVLCGISALGAGGIYMLAGSSGPDFDRVVNKPPMSVYAAFSALGFCGPASRRMTALVGPVTFGRPSSSTSSSSATSTTDRR